MSSWNFRVMKRKIEGPDEYEFGIHEVYYDDSMRAEMWTDAVQVTGASEEDIVWTLKKMLEATKKEVLDYDAHKKVD